MGSTYCKTAHSLKLPSLEKIINCPLQFCAESRTEMEDTGTPRVRKFSSSDISGPLPLGTVIAPPKRPPRKRKCKITRSCSVHELFNSSDNKINIMVRSKSAIELRLNDTSSVYQLKNRNYQCPPDEQQQQHNVIITCQPISLSSPSSSVITSQSTTVHHCTSSAVLAIHQEEQFPKTTTTFLQQQQPIFIKSTTADDNIYHQESLIMQLPLRPILPSPTASPTKLNKIIEEDFEIGKDVKVIQSSQIQGLISQNKKTFLATLLEENNNLRCTDSSYNKDINSNSSRKSSITESLREFESSLYEMLQENAANNSTEEDQASEHSLHLQQLAISR